MTKAERLELQAQKLIEMRAREDELHAAGTAYVAGIDEVGRGPLAGPVYAAVVVLPDGFDVLGINDSKKLSAKKREELSDIIKEQAVAYGIGIADNHEIDELNILNATKAAMLRAIDACNDKLAKRAGSNAGAPDDADAQSSAKIQHLLIDAVKLDVDIPQESIIKGDEKCLCIAAASIVAKVARDSFMVEMDEKYPGYDFAGNKGYGTAAHYSGLRELGYTPIHRRSFLRKFEEEQSGERAAAWGNSSRAAGSSVSDAEVGAGTESKMAKKVYAVRKGRETGLFTDWDTCKKQVDGFPGAEYKSFADPQEALAYLGLSGNVAREGSSGGSDGAAGFGIGGAGFGSADASGGGFEPGVRAYVDGSYDVATQKFSCGVVIVKTSEDGSVETVELNECYDDPTAAEQRNVAGEIMGSKVAIDYCIRNGIAKVDVYHDYEGVGKWADNLWKANNPLTQGYKAYVAKARQQIEIRFVKVKAHAGNKYNEMADRLAKAALEK